MIWGAARGFLYLWFSLAAGLACAYGIGFALSGTSGSTSTLPGGGWPLVITPPAFILASLVLGQLDHFGQRISLLKWIPACVVVTFALAAIAVSSL